MNSNASQGSPACYLEFSSLVCVINDLTYIILLLVFFIFPLFPLPFRSIVQIHANGDVYVGDLKGKYIWTDGTVYMGDWSKGKKDGKGKMIWPWGGSYEGGFKEDVRHGNGKCTWSDRIL